MNPKIKMASAMILFTFAASLIFSSSTALAYIPHSQTIVNRLVRNHGKGAYVVDQEIQFRTAGEPVILREKWIVENGETMRLIVSAPKATEGTRYDAIYRDGKRLAPDLEGNMRTSAVSPEFLEGFEHARSGRGFLAALVRAKIVSPQIMREHPHPQKIEQIKYQPEPLVRLGRTSGVVAWIFGEPTPSDARKANPGAWIEQDAFVLRRIRFPSEAEVASERHSTVGAFRMPRERTVTWGDHSALIRVLSVKPLGTGQAEKFLAPSSLNDKTAKAARLPDLAQIREFYSRFR